MATRFRFRLESLLRLRRSLEEEARRKLAARIQDRDALQSELEGLNLAFHQALESRRVGAGESIDLERLRATERFLVVQEQRIRLKQQELVGAEAHVEHARAVLTRAHQDHLTLVRLKERRQAEHTLQSEREEAGLLDEIAVLRHRFRSHQTPQQQVLP